MRFYKGYWVKLRISVTDGVTKRETQEKNEVRQIFGAVIVLRKQKALSFLCRINIDGDTNYFLSH